METAVVVAVAVDERLVAAVIVDVFVVVVAAAATVTVAVCVSAVELDAFEDAPFVAAVAELAGIIAVGSRPKNSGATEKTKPVAAVRGCVTASDVVGDGMKVRRG